MLEIGREIESLEKQLGLINDAQCGSPKRRAVKDEDLTRGMTFKKNSCISHVLTGVS